MARICCGKRRGVWLRAFRPAAPRRAGPACECLRQPRLALHRAQRRAVGELHGSDRRAFQDRHGEARRFQIVEQDQRARLVGVIGHGAIGDLAQESQRALGADHQVREDVDRVREIHQRIEAVAGGVLHAELVADARGEPFVVACGAGERIERVARVRASARRNAARLAASRVSSTVPSARTTRSPASV